MQEMIERADTDNDGLVSEEEFYSIHDQEDILLIRYPIYIWLFQRL